MADVEPLPKFPSPFVDGESVSMARFEPEEMEEMMLPDARTALERKLDTFTCAIREKPLWWEKVFKDDIVERWKTEALQQDMGSDMFDFGVQVIPPVRSRRSNDVRMASQTECLTASLRCIIDALLL